MTDEQLVELFARGTAPERDAAFARRVDAEINRMRFARRLVRAMHSLVLPALAGALFMAIRGIEPALARIAESSPRLMGVPLPLVVGVLSVALVVYVAGLRRRI